MLQVAYPLLGGRLECGRWPVLGIYTRSLSLSPCSLSSLFSFLLCLFLYVIICYSPYRLLSDPGAPRVRVLAPPGRIQGANFSLSLAPKVIASITSTLGVRAALPKSDLAAVPGFRSSALENWGLVSFE